MSRKKPPPIPLHPKLAELFDRRKEIEKELDKIESEITAVVQSLARNNRDKFLADVESGDDEYDLGNWECSGPLGRCVYSADDHYNDFCVFCGEPEERK